MNPQNGKGPERLHARQQVSNEQMQANWDKAFGKKITCPKCQSTEVSTIWVEGSAAVPEYEWAQCESCGNDWNECARD